jgi:hypothetical protein
MPDLTLPGRRRLMFALLVGSACLALRAERAHAADHFLTIGGGYAPSGNQLSLERNVLYFREVLARLYAKGANFPAHDVFFSDGDSPGRDLQYEDPAWQVPEANRLLARLADDEDDLGYRYRSHAIKDVRGSATRAALDKWFAEIGPKLAAGDRLVLYVTGHGSHQQGNYDNNFINLWNGGRLDVRRLAGMLDKLPKDVTVVVVMVQCYSGGFSNLLFAGGESDKGPSRDVRCGFFSTAPDRQAAGCTAEVNEANYQDYSSHFLAAISGTTRTGVAVDRAACDFDGNGTVTFAEAHAYVLLTDESIDVPNRTSDRFLKVNSDAGASGGRMVAAKDMVARLLAVASPADRAVVEGLSKQLELGGQYRYDAANELAESLRAQHKAIEQQQAALGKRYGRVRDAIWNTLELRWPELRNRWDPGVDGVLREEGDEVVRAIKAHPRYGQFTKLHDESGALSARDDALENRWAKSQRLVRTLERIALAHNLDQVADEETLTRYKALIAAEEGTFGAGKPDKP